MITCPFCKTLLDIDKVFNSYYCYCGGEESYNNLTYYNNPDGLFTIYVNFKSNNYFTLDWNVDSYRVYTVNDELKETVLITEATDPNLTPEQAVVILQHYVKLKAFI